MINNFDELKEAIHRYQQKSRIYFKTQGLEVQQVSRLASLRPSSFRSPIIERIPRQSIFYRFPSYPSYHDPKFPTYNANTIREDCLVVCEGPAPCSYVKPDIDFDPSSIGRFFENMLFNTRAGIHTILVAGLPDEGAYFENYFGQSTSYIVGDCIYNIESCSLDGTEGIKHYHIKVTKKTEVGEISMDVDLHQIINMPDFGVATLSEQDLQVIANLYQRAYSHNEVLLVHCAGGLGRSGLLSLALELTYDYYNCFDSSVDKTALNIFKKLQEIRRIRPALVQTMEQLIQAVDLSIKIQKIITSLTPGKGLSLL